MLTQHPVLSRRPLHHPLLAFLLLLCGLATSISRADFIAAVIPGSFVDYSAAYLVISGEAGTAGTITNNAGFNLPFTIGATQLIEIPIPQTAFVGNPDVLGSVVQEALFINADKPIGGYILRTDDLSSRPAPPPLATDRHFSSEVMPLLNTNQLGTRYRILQSTRASGPAFRADFVDRSIAIVATQDNTSVTYTPNEDLITPATLAGTPVTTTLNAGESIVYSSENTPAAIIDSSGGLVESSKPIAVFTYISRGFAPQITAVPLPILGRSLLGMQLPPSSSFGTEFVFAKTPYSNDNTTTTTGDDIIHVVADLDNTEIRVNGTLITTINAGESFSINGADGVESAVIETSNPVLAAQYVRSQGSDNFPGPAVTYLPPVTQTASRYLFNKQINATAIYTEEYLNIAIPTAALASLAIDGATVDTSSFMPIGTTGYSAGNILIPSDVGEITASQRFTATIVGYGNNSPYYGNYLSLPVGLSSPTSKIPALTPWFLSLIVLLLGSMAVLYRRKTQIY